MKKTLSVLLCAVLCACTLSTAAPAFAKAVADAEKTMLIVELEGENALEMLGEGMTLQSALRPIDAERKNAVQAIESVSGKAEVTYTYTHVLNGVAVEAARADAAKIERLDGVRAVYDVGGVKARGRRIADRDAESRVQEHIPVVVGVARGGDLILRDSEPLGQPSDGSRLGGVGVHKFHEMRRG